MIYVLECDHAFQTPTLDPLCSQEIADVLRQQKNLFKEKIEEILDGTSPIHLIGEETKWDEDTYARAIAEERNLRYVNIDIPKKQRKAAGIPDEYTELPEDHQIPYHRIREKHFYEQTTNQLNPGENTLVICGRIHVKPLVDLFTKNREKANLIALTSTEGFDWEWFIPRI